MGSGWRVDLSHLHPNLTNCLDSEYPLLYLAYMRKDKARDIARGVLPSTARKGARENKRAFHAKRRHNQNQTDHALARHLAVEENGRLHTDVDLYDDFEDPIIHDGYHASTKGKATSYNDDMSEIVSDRRDADKLGPLISWATATEKNKMAGWDVADKIAYFKAVLPDTLQGRHALGHVQSALGLHNDEFYYRFGRYAPTPPYTKERFRADLARHLSTNKARAALREHVLDAVPVAAHSAYANNKRRTIEPVVDENGAPRYGTYPARVVGGVARPAQNYRIMVEMYEPQVITVTCDDCAFLRNDPLATTEAINRFVEIVWDRGRSVRNYFRPKYDINHPFLHKIVEYIRG